MTSFEKVVVTGGAGLIGSHILDRLVEGQRVGTYGDIVVFDNFTRGRMYNIDGALRQGRIDIVEGDVRNGEAVTKVIDGADLVFHLAAIRITHLRRRPTLGHGGAR